MENHLCFSPYTRHSRRKRMAAASVGLASFFFMYWVMQMVAPRARWLDVPEPYLGPHHRPPSPAQSDFIELVQRLIRPQIPPFAEPWTAPTGETFAIEEAIVTKPLGSDVVVIDVDNRFGEEFFVGKNERLEWRRGMDYESAGTLNHYMWASIHGYDYQAMKPEYNIDYHPTWYKVGGIHEALKTHKYVVFLDGDALFPYLELPVEWMINHWNLNDSVALAGGEVPSNPNHRDYRNWDLELKYPKINTGFLIIQQTDITEELMQAWLDCPTGHMYPGCTKLRHKFPHEQGALADYIRLDERFHDYIVALGCDEADGNPKSRFCKGKLIEHMWGFKDRVKRDVSIQVARCLLNPLYDNLLESGVLTPLTEIPSMWAKGLAWLPWRRH